jgi:spore maturation protein CgeB
MLFAGTFWTGSSEAGLSQGFRDDGWCVQEAERSNYWSPPSDHLMLRVASRLSRKIAFKWYQKHILAECESLRPEVFFTVKGIGIDADLLRKIRLLGTRTIMYYPDFHFDHNNIDAESFSEYDLFITTKSFQIEYLANAISRERVAYVPHGFSPSVHRPIYPALSKDFFVTDVIHAGNHSSYKQQWLANAASALPEVSFRIIGSNWRVNAGDGPLSKADMPGPKIGVAYAQAIQTARINVAVHMGETSSGWADLVSTRTFEIPACGGFMLHIDNMEVREFYTPGVEIDVFQSHQELTDKIKFYLSRPDLRAKMIARAYERCVPHYSYNNRAKVVSDLLKEKGIV